MNKKEQNSGDILSSVASLLSPDALEEIGNPPVIEEASIEEESEDSEEIVDPSSTPLDETLEENEEEIEVEVPEVNEDKVPPVVESSDENLISTSDDLEGMEPEIASYLEEKLYDKLGWSIEEEDKRADSVDSIVDLLQEVVTENSKPIYASEDIEKLDEYVRDGGTLREYFAARYTEDFDISKVNLEREADQEKILREYFKTQGHKADRIDKRIQKYDDTGILQDEAEDALELLKEIKEAGAEKLLKEQGNLQQQRLEEQQKFINDVTSYIDNKKDALGVPLNKVKKDKLKANILKVGKDGMTEYQRAYNESMISNLVDSAFLATMRDEFNTGVTKKASSTAAGKLKKKIQSSKSNLRQKSSGSNATGDNDLLGRISKGLE